MVAGPGMLGTGVASADLFGIDIDILDIFDHKEKKKSDHSAKIGNQRNGGPKKSGGSLGGPNASTGPKAKVGASESSAPSARSASTAQAPQSAGVTGATGQAPQSAGVTGTTGQAPSAAVIGGTAQAPTAVVSGGGGGGAGVPTNGNIGRAPNLAPVPTAPSSRQIVIRSSPPKAPVPAAPAAPVAPAPVVVAPVPVIPAPVPFAPPVGAAPSAPVNPAPRSEPPAVQALSVPPVPESFRLGYTDYLRTASTSDLLFAVLPGLGGMLLMTAAGGVVGFRQARAAQTLPAPQIARFLP